MAHNWTAVHARKLAAYQRLGVAVSFSETSPGTYNETTGLWTGPPVTVTVAGYAVRGKGDPVMYEKLNLNEGEAPTLDFMPTTMGQTPSPGMQLTFGGDTYAVRNVAPFAPAGSTISARVIVERG